MGRGLSPLQRFILVEAGRRPRLYYADVLSHFYGFRTRRGAKLTYYQDHDLDTPSTWRDGGELLSPGTQRFDPKEIGERRYRSALAALSRACRRLRERGLVHCRRGQYSHWAGVELTDKGRELSVNLTENFSQVNR
jgi:hypothetical protein